MRLRLSLQETKQHCIFTLQAASLAQLLAISDSGFARSTRINHCGVALKPAEPLTGFVLANPDVKWTHFGSPSSHCCALRHQTRVHAVSCAFDRINRPFKLDATSDPVFFLCRGVGQESRAAPWQCSEREKGKERPPVDQCRQYSHHWFFTRAPWLTIPILLYARGRRTME
jgi:hypothetical protein